MKFTTGKYIESHNKKFDVTHTDKIKTYLENNNKDRSYINLFYGFIKKYIEL